MDFGKKTQFSPLAFDFHKEKDKKRFRTKLTQTKLQKHQIARWNCTLGKPTFDPEHINDKTTLSLSFGFPVS